MSPKNTKRKCSVKTCKKYSDNFIYMPKDIDQCKKWCEILHLDQSIKDHRLCHDHFRTHDLGPKGKKLKRDTSILPLKVPVRYATIDHKLASLAVLHFDKLFLGKLL